MVVGFDSRVLVRPSAGECWLPAPGDSLVPSKKVVVSSSPKDPVQFGQRLRRARDSDYFRRNETALRLQKTLLIHSEWLHNLIPL